MDNAPKITPMMAQYNAVKAQYPDALVMMRMGDFYEMIGEDAERAAPVLHSRGPTIPNAVLDL